MDCLSCRSLYDEGIHCPRLLIHCGHSICESCLRANFANGGVVCPACKKLNKADSIDMIPKNLALIYISATNILEKDLVKLSETLFESRKDPSTTCQKHQKKYEGKAAQKERNILQKLEGVADMMKANLRSICGKIIDARKTLIETGDKTLNEITSTFAEIRKIINERENTLKNLLADQIKAQDAILRNKQTSTNNQLQKIQDLHTEYKKSLTENDFVILSAAPSRLEIIKQAIQDIGEFEFNAKIEPFNKEKEINALVKILNPSKAKDILSSYEMAKMIKSQNSPLTPTSKKLKESTLKKSSVNSLNDRSGIIKKEFLIPTAVISKLSGEKNGNKISQMTLNSSRDSSTTKDEDLRMSSKLSTSIRSSTLNKHFNFSQERGEEVFESKVPEVVGINLAPYRRKEYKPSKANISLTQSTPRSNSGSKYYVKSPAKTEINGNTSYALNLKSSQYSQYTQQSERPKYNHDFNLEDYRDDNNLAQNTSKDSLQTNEELLEFLNSEKSPRNEVLNHTEKLDIAKIKNSYNSMMPYNLPNDVTVINQNKLDLSALCQQIKSYIYIIGGFIENSQLHIERYDMQKNQWQIVGKLKNSRTKFASVLLPNRKVLIMGGKQDGMRLATCEEYDYRLGTTRQSDFCLRGNKSGFESIIHKNELYICGGNDGSNILKTMERYSFNDGTWKTLSPLKFRRDEFAMTLGPDGKIYVVGGFGGPNNACLSAVERYDIQKNVWESVAPLNTPRRALAIVTLPDGIYAIGGFDGKNYLSSVERYDETKNRWIYVKSMNHPRCTTSAIASADFQNIYVFGGFDNSPLKSAEKYSVIDNTWETIPSMNFKRFMHTAILITEQSDR